MHERLYLCKYVCICVYSETPLMRPPLLASVLNNESVSDIGTDSTFLIQHQTRFQITTSIILNDEGDSYVLGVNGGAGLSSATV